MIERHFVRENLVAFIILLRVFVMAETSYQMLEVLYIILRSREGLTSSNVDNNAMFSNEKKVQ